MFMKINKKNILVLVLLVVIAALYRVWESRPLGFAPQIAMALFAGSVIRDKKISFLFPLLSMLLSDALYQVLYSQGLSNIKGFYEGQWVIYILFISITVIGFWINQKKLSHIIIGSLGGAIFFFITSNFFNWLGGGWDINNLPYPKTFNGLITCFEAGIPFFKGSLYATLIFNAIFFGSYFFAGKYALKPAKHL